MPQSQLPLQLDMRAVCESKMGKPIVGSQVAHKQWEGCKSHDEPTEKSIHTHFSLLACSRQEVVANTDTTWMS